MNDLRCCYLLFALFLLVACGKPDGTPSPARLRIGQFLYAADPVRVTLAGPLADSMTLGYGSLTEYRRLPPGTYTVDVSAGDQHLLHESIGLGTGGSYSLLLTGIPQEGQEVNQATFGTRLHRIFEGAAARTDNDFLPQLFVQNDYFVPVSGKGNLRVTQLVPGLVPIDLRLERQDEQQGVISGVAYAYASDRERFTAGRYTATLHLAGSPQDRLSFSLELDTSSFTNVYVLPDTTANRRIQVVMGKTVR